MNIVNLLNFSSGGGHICTVTLWSSSILKFMCELMKVLKDHGFCEGLRLIQVPDIYNAPNEKTAPIYFFYTQYLSSWHFLITFLSHDGPLDQYELSILL